MTEPGTATIHRLGDGSRVVLRADPIISVATKLLSSDPSIVGPDGVLNLDSEGLYRYRFLRNDGRHYRIYERITEDPS